MIQKTMQVRMCVKAVTKIACNKKRGVRYVIQINE